MGAVAAPVAAFSSLASMGMGLASSSASASATRAQGDAVAAGDNYQANLADEAAKFGKLQATLTDTTMRENLTRTLASIDAIRAGGNADPTSPTTTAIEKFNTMISNRQRMAAVGSQREQADYDTATADYLRKAGSYAQVAANVSANNQMFGGFAKFFTGLGSAFMPGGGFGLNLASAGGASGISI